MAERASSVKKDNEWEDVTEEWETVSSAPTKDTEQAEVDKPWYVDAFDFLKDAGTGFAKGAGTIATTPSRLMTDLGVPGYKGQDYSYLEPKGTVQQFTSGMAEAVPYVVGGVGEGALALKALSGLSRPMAIAGKTAIGAGGGAAASYMSGESPTAGALYGGATPLTFGLMQKPISAIGQKMRQSALYSMGKAIGANYLNRGREYVERKILQPLLDRGEMFWNLRGLENKMRASAADALAKRDAIRAGYPQDYSIPMNEVEDALVQAGEKFSGVQVAPGQTMPSGQRDIGKRMFIQGKLQPDVWKASNPALAVAKDISGEEMVKQGYLPGMKGQNVLFDTLEDFKQDWAGFARQHGKYQGKKMVGQIPESTVEVEAKYEAANEVRNLLKKYMPGEWDAMNNRFHIDKQIADLAEQRDLARMGDPAAMAETMLGEAPSAYKGRVIARGYMKAIRSPAFNSAMANLKDTIGKKLVGAQGFKSGQALSFLDGLLRNPDVSVDVVDNPEETYQPGAPEPGQKRIRYNPETDTFEAVP
jgi:hypothetical protein